MSEQSKKYTGFSEKEALRDMLMTERHLLDCYRAVLETGGSTRVRACMIGGFCKAAGDLNDVTEEAERRFCSAMYAREEDEQKIALKYKRYLKEIKNSINTEK